METGPLVPDEARPPSVTRRLYPAPATVAPEEIYSDLVLPEGPPHRPYVLINMVSTVDGKVAVGGRAAGLGSKLDRALMRRLRAAVDGVMVGAGTLRAEPVAPGVPGVLAAERGGQGQPEQPLAITLSRRLHVNPEHPFFGLGPESTVIFTSLSAQCQMVGSLSTRATVERVGQSEVDLEEALACLRRRYGVGRLLVEGGPTLNQQLIEHGLVDELFCTIAPKLAGGSGPGMLTGSTPASSIAARLGLASLFENRGELYARYYVKTAQ